MGGSASIEDFLRTPLTPQTDFPFAINKRFSQPRTTTLLLTDNFWGKAGLEGYVIKNAYSGKVIFRVETTVTGVAPLEKTKWLVDAYKIPVAHLDELWTYTAAYDLYIGKGDDRFLTQFEIPLDCIAVKAAVYQDEDTGKKSCVGVHGVWRQRSAFIFYDSGMIGARQLIAKVSRPDSAANKKTKFGSAPYHVEIAPGVDIAFIVLCCAALDHAMQMRIDTRS